MSKNKNCFPSSYQSALNLTKNFLNNTDAFLMFKRLMSISISMFEWKGLPPEIDKDFLERTLFINGQILFFKDDVSGLYAALPMTANGDLNIYGIPNKRIPVAQNRHQYRNTFDDSNSVLIFNDNLHMGSIIDCQRFAERLSNMDNTLDININAQKTPILISCDEKQKLSLLNMYKQYKGNTPAIFTNKSISKDSIQAIQTGAPFIAPDLYQIRTDIWNEALTYLGIANQAINKKERLISDEVNRAQGGTIASGYSRLASRQNAAEQINKIFGLNISVDYRSGLDELIKNVNEDVINDEESEDDIDE